MIRLVALAGALFTGLPVPAQVPARTADEVLRLGGIDAAEHLSFTRAPQLLMLDADRLMVLDPATARVSILGGDGGLLAEFGGAGEGPGEFTAPLTSGRLGDSLWIVDFPSPRVSLFSPAGEHLRTERLPVVDFGVPTSAPTSITNLLRDGFALAVPSGFPLGVEDRVAMPVLHGTRTWDRVRPVSERVMPDGLFVKGLGVFGFTPVRIPPLTIPDRYGRGWVTVGWDPDDPGPLALAFFDADGSPRVEARPLVEVRPLDRATREAFIAQALELAGPYIEQGRTRGEVRGSARDLVEAGLFLPAALPPVADGFLDAEGRLWLQRGSEDSAEWLVFDADGQLEMQLELPPGVTLRTAAGNTGWGVALDDFDVPYLVKLTFE